MPNPGSDRVLAILALTLLGAGCVLVLWPFLTALVWAAILASTSWPAFRWLDRSVGERRTVAACLMTLLVTVVLLGPIAAVALVLLLSAVGLTRIYRSPDRNGQDYPAVARSVVRRAEAGDLILVKVAVTPKNRKEILSPSQQTSCQESTFEL